MMMTIAEPHHSTNYLPHERLPKRGSQNRHITILHPVTRRSFFHAPFAFGKPGPSSQNHLQTSLARELAFDRRLADT